MVGRGEQSLDSGMLQPPWRCTTRKIMFERTTRSKDTRLTGLAVMTVDLEDVG